jgi:uncharacterized RDD family membrane protein YckC
MSQSSMYESAPPAPNEPPPGRASGPRAGFWRRFAADFIDGLVLVIPYIIVALIFKHSPALRELVTLLIGLGYYTYFEGGESGATVGKRAMGIRVYDFRHGGPIGYGRAFIRYIGRIVSTIPLFLGYFWMLWDGEKQTWHDKFAGCVVVPTDAYR